MIQLRRENDLALGLDALQSAVACAPAQGAALEDHVNALIEQLRQARRDIARGRGWAARLGVRLDEALRTEAVEHMDDPAYSERGKWAIAQGLHLLNSTTGAYRKFYALIEPILKDIALRHGRPPRVLELACGTGGFALEIAKLAAARKFDLEVTGSDIVPLYVSRAEDNARRLGVNATFRRVDALTMNEVADGAFDLVFIGQSVHHFSPGQLSRMVAESRRICTGAFVAVDGYRSLSMVAFVIGTALLTCWPAMVHDASISARRFYSERELELIARLGAPAARIRAQWLPPLYSSLVIRFDGGEECRS